MPPYDPKTDMQVMTRRILELTEENNKMLKKRERRDMWARIFRAFYWAVILLVALGSYYFLQPYLEILKDSFGTVSNNFNQVEGFLNNLPSR